MSDQLRIAFVVEPVLACCQRQLGIRSFGSAAYAQPGHLLALLSLLQAFENQTLTKLSFILDAKHNGSRCDAQKGRINGIPAHEDANQPTIVWSQKR